ncbi:GNAT family N-acetyltransferase [Prauserella shujinwangii]|uniref:GNAT family N-acetyltransferase n=1 Tax=Prauserella shujinwangii TaxID=1453103 RepID=UPI000D0615F8
MRDADRAAQAAGVAVRRLTRLEELDAVVGLLSEIWGRAGNPPVTLELLRAFTKAGNYVSGAFEDGRLVGACVGFFHAPDDDALHSHIAGVSGLAAGRSIGFALKLHQRAWALRRGVSDIAWTFDPLVSRNAYFNLVKLAARPVEYLPNFYGAMADSINGHDDTDRLLMRWRLDDAEVHRACAGTHVNLDAAGELAAGAVVALDRTSGERPRPGRLDGRTSLVAVPRDIERMRVTDPGLAHEWRITVREALMTLADDGGRVVGFDRAGWYVVRRTP